MPKSQIDRRNMIHGLVVLAGISTLPSCSRSGEPSKGGNADIAQATLLSRTDYSSAHAQFIEILSDIIIPDTDTPGALRAGAPQQMVHVLSEWMNEEGRKEWVNGLADIQEALDRSQKISFLQGNRDAQARALIALDKAAYQNRKAPEFYRTFKTALGAAYYLSELGATEELRYEAIPGEWKSCVPFDTIGKTWAV